ncbi:hypothetical protein [Dethiobacter alkaliphilus]|uniref:hypothetical protein n=1 Tax=Dethiobacter alkaliphilus TaxID=427926 RepID=UPI0022264E5C|nr:hypothetical protein [Dethiobacter alkaliphilus]MCW3491616.1 hypothetical protein [Dethiobacter alkaliphilus]
MQKKNMIIACILAALTLFWVQGCIGSSTQYLSLELTQDELGIYQEFSETRDDRLLAGLAPLQVFKLWLYADRNQDYNTQYYLFNTDKMQSAWMIEPLGEQEFLQLRKNRPVDMFLRHFNEVISVQEDTTLGDENNMKLAFEQKDGSEFLFWMQKNSYGNWKVRWEPFDVRDNYRERLEQ